MEITVQGPRLVAEKDEYASAEGQLFARRVLFFMALFIAVAVPVSVINTVREADPGDAGGIVEIILSILPAVALLIAAPFFLRNSLKAIEAGEIVRLEIDTRRRIVLMRTRTIDESVETYRMLTDLVAVELVDTSTEDMKLYGVSLVFRDGSEARLWSLEPELAVGLWDNCHRLLKPLGLDIAWIDRRPNADRRRLPTHNLSMLTKSARQR